MTPLLSVCASCMCYKPNHPKHNTKFVWNLILTLEQHSIVTGDSTYRVVASNTKLVELTSEYSYNLNMKSIQSEQNIYLEKYFCNII